MLWYNNPEAVAAMHEQTLRERYDDRMRRSLLRLVEGGDVAERH
jgi:hypothetical protein